MDPLLAELQRQLLTRPLAPDEEAAPLAVADAVADAADDAADDAGEAAATNRASAAPQAAASSVRTASSILLWQ